MTVLGGLVSGILVMIAGLALVYRYRERLNGQPLYVHILVVAILLVAALTTGFVIMGNDRAHVNSMAGVTVDQNPGIAQITIIDPGNIDSLGLVGPGGTESTTGSDRDFFRGGLIVTLRSNDEVIGYLNDPGNNITVLTESGTKTVKNVGELPSEYQMAPDGLINPDADIGNYANASVATVACLFDHGGVGFGGRRIPANVSIPCNTPVLGQNDSVKVGTSVKPTSGQNAGKTLTSPITLRNGEYTLVGTTVDGEEHVVQSFVVDDEVAKSNAS